MPAPSILHKGSLVDTIFKPIELAAFTAEHWQQKPLLLGARSADHFGDLLTPADIERLLLDPCWPGEHLELLSGAEPTPPDQYKPYGHVDPAAVAACHQRGASIILRQAQLYHRKLRDMCTAVSNLFRCPTQASLHLTHPLPETQGPAPTNWLPQDLFVLQLMGTSRWQLHTGGPQFPHPHLPNRTATGADAYRPGELSDTLCLQAGHTAYIPRGQFHALEPQTYSVHIALTVQAITAYDVLAYALDAQLRHDPALRAAIPLTSDGSGLQLETFEKQVHTLLTEHLLGAPLAQAAATLLDQTAARTHAGRPSQPLLPPLTASQAPAPHTHVSLVTRLPSRTSCEINGSCRVLVNGTEFQVPRAQAAMMDYLLTTGGCKVEELPGDDLALKQAIVQQLLNEGCISAAPQALEAPEVSQYDEAPLTASAPVATPNDAETQSEPQVAQVAQVDEQATVRVA